MADMEINIERVPEVGVYALRRVLDMADKAQSLLGAQQGLPDAVATKREAMLQRRNAYEHIEDSAFGQDHKREDLSVLTTLNHHELVINKCLACRGHTLDLATKVPQLLTELRTHFKTMAGTT